MVLGGGRQAHRQRHMYTYTHLSPARPRELALLEEAEAEEALREEG